MTFICQYCNVSFSRSNNLLQHQQTTKYCLSLQYKQAHSTEHLCTFCNAMYTTEKILHNHQTKCIPFIIDRTKKEKDDAYALLLDE